MSYGNPIFGLFWIILLIFVAWPIAGFLCSLWLFLQPFEAACRCVRDLNDFLEKIITWPRECGRAIVDCSNQFPRPF